MTLTRYGFREWGFITVVSAVAGGLLAWYGHGWGQWAAVGVAVLWAAAVAFFRDPWGRHPASDAANDMVSPADGKVSAVFDVDHHPATGGPAKVVRIFLSVLDVHINRFPCDGEVVSVTNVPGRYLDARSEESARVNESTTMVIRTASGETLGVRQVSGAIARRIVCPVTPGSRAKRGARYGMIKFGSTTELILPRPRDIDVHVAVGQRVVGGVTILATMRAPR